MRNTIERPVCHRAEDLVTYLYGEASPADAQDFSGHLRQCDACRAEYAIFQGVHESIVEWRNEALGAVSPATAPLSTPVTAAANQFIQRPRKLSAMAALREFFSVSPFWLRGATGVAALLMLVMVALAVTRIWQQPAQVAKGVDELKYSQKQLDDEVNKRLSQQAALIKKDAATATNNAPPRNDEKPATKDMRVQLASTGSQQRARLPKGLTRQEREQLAADLGLIPGRDSDEFPFVFTDEPE